MSRQYVHLSVDTAMAEQVGRRKAKAPVILAVNAGLAHASAVRFYRGNDLVWLADEVPPAFIGVAGESLAETRGQRARAELIEHDRSSRGSE